VNSNEREVLERDRSPTVVNTWTLCEAWTIAASRRGSWPSDRERDRQRHTISVRYGSRWEAREREEGEVHAEHQETRRGRKFTTRITPKISVSPTAISA